MPVQPLEIVLHHEIDALTVMFQTVHVLAARPQILGCNLETFGYVAEDVAEDILSHAVLVGRIVSVLLADGYRRISARYGYVAPEVDLCGSLPAVHRHGLYRRRLQRIRRKVEPRTGQILNVRGDAFAVDAVEEELENSADMDIAARLYAPAEECGIAVGSIVVQIHVAEYCGCADVALTVFAPSDLQIDRKIGNPLRNRIESRSVGTRNVRHFGGDTERHVVACERYLVAENRCEIEVVGIRTLKIDCAGRSRQVAESGYVATDGQTEERNVARAQTRSVTALTTAAEVGVEEYHYPTETAAVGDSAEIDARSRCVHFEFLLVGIVANHRYVVRHDVDVVDGAVEAVCESEIHVTAYGERECIAAVGENHARCGYLLESCASGFAVVLNRTANGDVFLLDESLLCEHRVVIGIITIYRIGFLYRYDINRRFVAVAIPRIVTTLCRCSDRQ